MAKKTNTHSTKSCSDCIHEYACRMWTDGRMISDESASRCTNHTTVKESAAYLIGKMDGEKHVIPTADVAPRAEVAREIFWEIDKLLLRIITDDEQGTQFIGVDMQKYYALKKKYTATTDKPPKGERYDPN